MGKLYGNAIVGQSGGPTAAINATLSGVVRGCLAAEQIKTVYGAINGVEGILNETICDLGSQLNGEDKLRLLEQTPAAALGSCRKKLPKYSDDPEIYNKLLEIFKKYDIRYFFYIGGNDSMDTVAKLSSFVNGAGYEMRVMGVPKTIDNDLVGTDHTPGFGSAAKYIATVMQEILLDTAVYTTKAVTIVEFMGRDAGWLTAAAALTRKHGVSPDMIYLPEVDFDFEKFYEDIEKAFETHPNVVVAVSEGARTSDGKYVGESAQSGAVDVFGHKYLSGTGKALEMAVKAKFGCKVRSVEINLPQRCAAHLRSKTDIDESIMVGRGAVEAATAGETGKMACFIRENGEEYRCSVGLCDISSVANAIKKVPREMINERGNNVTDACVDYIFPLICGEADCVYDNGLPAIFKVKN